MTFVSYVWSENHNLYKMTRNTVSAHFEVIEQKPMHRMFDISMSIHSNQISRVLQNKFDTLSIYIYEIPKLRLWK